MVDWSTYVVDRGDFKLLQNSIFPDKDGNVFVETEAGSIILTEKVTNIGKTHTHTKTIFEIYSTFCGPENLKKS